MRASVVIPSHNEGILLWRTVRSCLQTISHLDCELLVADDASTDGSIEELRLLCPDVRVAAHPKRMGVSTTKDLGVRQAKGDVVVLIDGHCKPEPGAVERLIQDVEELEGQAVVTPAVPALDVKSWELRSPIGYGFCIKLPTFRCGWVDKENLKKRGRFLESPALVGCCLAVSRILYEKLLGFDTDMSQYGFEDIDFGHKAWLMGYSILNDPQAKIGHRFRSCFDSYSVEREHVVNNNLRMARKHFRDRIWNGWLKKFQSNFPEDLWKRIWALFCKGEKSLERERAYLMENRVRGEYWYSGRFGLDWPPYPSARELEKREVF